jgi:hypothetical protein
MSTTTRIGSRPAQQARAEWLTGARADVAAIAVLLALTAAVSWDLVRVANWVSRVDLLTFYLPWYAHLGERLRALDIPGWNPYVFSGTPFAGDPQSGWAYLPAMLAFSLLPPIAAMKAYAVIHLIIGGVITYALARVLGMPVLASLVAASAFEFGPYVVHNSRCCTIMAQIAPWIPLAMLGIELGLRTKSWPARGLSWWLAGLAISQMMAGWIGQGAYNGMLVVASYVAYRTLIQPPSGHTRVRTRIALALEHSAAVFLLGFTLGAAGLLIRLDVNAATNLARGAYEELSDGSRPWPLLGMLDRILSTDPSTLKFYVGGATLALAILAPLAARAQFAVPYFAVYTAIVLTLTLEPTPLHRVFYLLPQYQSLHEHSAYRIVGILWVGPAILAGATVASLPRWTRRPWAIGAALLPIAALLALAQALKRQDEAINGETYVAVAGVSAVLALASACSLRGLRDRLRARSHLPPAAATLLVLGLVIWDPTGRAVISRLGTSTNPEIEQATERAASADDPGGAGEFLLQRLREEGPFRYFGYDPIGLRTADTDGLTYHGRRLDPDIQALLVSARAMRLGMYDIQGYNPVQLKRYVEFIEAINGLQQDYHDANIHPPGLRSPLLNLLNPRYIIIPNNLPPGRPRPDLVALMARTTEVFHNERVRVLRNDAALPRAWIVHDALRVERGEALDLLASGGVDPRETVLLETDPPPLGEPAAATDDAVRITHYEADRIKLTAQTTAAGVLVVSEVYDEGWRAYVDGRRVPLLVADHVLRAVALAPGEHVIEMRYEPASLRAGVRITAGALLLLPMLALAATRARWTSRRHSTV